MQEKLDFFSHRRSEQFSKQNTRILTFALMSERIGAKTFAKKYLPGSVGMDEIGFQSFDFSPMHPKLQTFLASIRLSSRVRHLNIKICSFEYYLGGIL